MKQRLSTFLQYLISCLFLLTLISTTYITKEAHNCQYSYLKYDVEIQDKNVGWMTSAKKPSTTEPNVVQFVIDSKVDINIIASYNIQYKLESNYKLNELTTSNYATKVNGDTQSYATVRWDGAKYIGWDGKKNSTVSTIKIIHSIGNLYYKEPIGLTEIFSEKFMAFCPIVKNGEYYTISFPDGKSSTYKYQNGICVWVESKQKLYKIVFRLKEIK
jgi:hypothetical protein